VNYCRRATRKISAEKVGCLSTGMQDLASASDDFLRQKLREVLAERKNELRVTVGLLRKLAGESVQLHRCKHEH
jgi:hypothetical protein